MSPTTATDPPTAAPPPALLHYNLLQEPLLHYRRVDTGQRVATNLPALFIAMAQDAVRDFPALRPHQRHPWHAFLVQLAAIALHHAGRTAPFETEDQWRKALLALTPDDPDGAAWCLVSPPSRPAFMQAPLPKGGVEDWKNVWAAADTLDMLITSKNHDLKAARMVRSAAEAWCFSLISLQTQEGVLGAGNYGISRMNKGYGSRCGVGVVPIGNWGKRWARDVQVLHSARAEVVENLDLRAAPAHTLLWVLPWDGSDSLSFGSLDPWYIEICRRIRLTRTDTHGIRAHAISSSAPRIAAKELCGVTGDPWTPVDPAAATALTISGRGFDYKLATDVFLGQKYAPSAAQKLQSTDGDSGLQFIAQGLTRGQGKTEGYHERRIPISPKMRKAFAQRQTDAIASIAKKRIEAIGEVRKMLWSALVVLFSNAAKDETGKDRDAADGVKDRANTFSKPFEAACDALFFIELTVEIEASQPLDAWQDWLCQIADRADKVLTAAFTSGPRNGLLRYRAQAAARGRLHGSMRSQKSKLPDLAIALQQRSANTAPATSTLTEDTP